MLRSVTHEHTQEIVVKDRLCLLLGLFFFFFPVFFTSVDWCQLYIYSESGALLAPRLLNRTKYWQAANTHKQLRSHREREELNPESQPMTYTHTHTLLNFNVALLAFIQGNVYSI